MRHTISSRRRSLSRPRAAPEPSVDDDDESGSGSAVSDGYDIAERGGWTGRPEDLLAGGSSRYYLLSRVVV